MTVHLRRLALIALAAATACVEPGAPVASARDLRVRVPAHGVDAVPEVPALSLADETPQDYDGPPEAPEEFSRAAFIKVAWTRASVGNGYAGAEAYMEYWGNIAEQALSLLVLADGREVASPPPAISGEAWPLPVNSSLRTFSSVPIAGECGIMALGRTQHHARNEVSLPGVPSYVFSRATVPSSHDDGQLTCPDSTVRQPAEDGLDSGDGGSGDTPDGDQAVYLSCWWKLTFEGERLVDVEALSCTLISS